jgi:hypothetical protein
MSARTYLEKKEKKTTQILHVNYEEGDSWQQGIAAAD